MKTKRKSVSKKIRFEVFKRDSFTCQYCGKKAPDVVLHVDHIHPVSKGGTNDLMNLVTSCECCNSGKSDRELTDSSVVSKRNAQATALQLRREQIEMIAEWQRGLSTIDDAAFHEANKYFCQLTGGWELDNDSSGPKLRTAIMKHGLAEVMSIMRKRTAMHLRIDQENKRATHESALIICRTIFNDLKYKEANERDPETAGALYAAGIARNRLRYIPPNHRLIFIEWARAGVSSQELKDAAQLFNTWEELRDGIEERIDAL